MPFEPLTLPYNSWIELFTKQLAGKPDLMLHCSKVKERMEILSVKYPGFKPDITTYYLLLNAFSKTHGDMTVRSDAFEAATKLFNELERN